MGYHPKINDELPDDAAVLTVVRIDRGALRTYTPVTGKERARSFCYTWLNRARAIGGLTTLGAEDEYAIVDVEDSDRSNIVSEFALNRHGYDYLKKKLKLKWENKEEWRSSYHLDTGDKP